MHAGYIWRSGRECGGGVHGRLLRLWGLIFQVLSQSGQGASSLISKLGIEVDRAKLETIASLPPPTSIKTVRSFLGHAGFYRRFIR
ncbi:Retrovirus-related Pol polyprotein from transposon opus, partial [Linum perenne]